MTFDRETVGAYIDGELDEIRRRRIDKALETDAALAALVAKERQLRSALQARFDPIATAPVPERLLAAVAAAPVAMPRKPSRVPQWTALAASLAVAAYLGLHFDQARSGGLQGPLATALETQLASTQASSGPIRIGLTFKARDGHWCRTFAGPERSGIACREDGGWQLRHSGAPAATKTEYRQASTSEINQAAQALAAEPPLDADGEAQLIGSGWR